MTSGSFAEEDLQKMLEDIAQENAFQNPRYEISPATKAGDNFMGRVIRAVIHEDGKESLSLIFKTAPVSKTRRDAVSSGRMFHNEGIMYNTVLPTLNAYLQEHGLSESDNYPYTARCISSRISEDPTENNQDVLVLEDLARKGYQMTDRIAGLDAEKCNMVLRELARLHATSIGLRDQRPDEAARLEANLREVIYLESNPFIASMLPVVENCLVMVEDTYPPGSPEHTKLKHFVDNYLNEMADLVKPNETLSCVTHGDCWSNNVLFKFDENDAVDSICLLDFQIARVASPVLDITYLMYTCTSKETRDAHYQEFLETYHHEATRILDALGCDPQSLFSWATFQEQLKLYGRYGLGMALMTMPFFLVDPSEMPDLDVNNADFGEVLRSVHITRLDECKKRIVDVLTDCIEQGILN